MLVGVSEAYNYDAVRHQIQTWLDPGTITLSDNHLEFVKVDRLFRSIVLRSDGIHWECRFSISPTATLVNPAFTLENWKGDSQVEVFLNGIRSDFKAAKEGNALLIWIPATITQKTNVLIRPINDPEHENK
jgi:hypothetical protein